MDTARFRSPQGLTSMLESLVFYPCFAGGIMLAVGNSSLCRLLLPLVALVHTGISTRVIIRVACGERPAGFFGLLCARCPGNAFSSCLQACFFWPRHFTPSVICGKREQAEERTCIHDGRPFTNAPERRFTACLCFFLSAMSMVTTTPHLGVLWVGIEATTLSSAPLIYFHQHRRSLEATWKYLIIICSAWALPWRCWAIFVSSIAFCVPQNGAATIVLTDDVDSLFGWFMAHAGQASLAPGSRRPLSFCSSAGMAARWALRPLHNWLPDAHSEAPSLVSWRCSPALSSGPRPAWHFARPPDFAGRRNWRFQLLAARVFGLVSLVIAAIFICWPGALQKNAGPIPSVEHMGAIGSGHWRAGGLAVQGALLHSICHSLAKCLLFLLSGNILARYHTYSSYDVHGMRLAMPVSGALWLAGFLAVAGSPPFGIFVSEMLVLKGNFRSWGPGFGHNLYLLPRWLLSLSAFRWPFCAWFRVPGPGICRQKACAKARTGLGALCAAGNSGPDCSWPGHLDTGLALAVS